ncbi:MAG TPA: recombinase family protein, partial [Candidatus Limnocylindria bacterium]|nr:recombinase family protein [Candidatus Limnocylindria bacterium]
MTGERKRLRCAVYTRVSTDHGLEQEFNSLDAQREAARAYIKSQAHEGWIAVRESFDDGGYSGGSLDRPALQHLLDAIRARRIDVVVVYKVDRLTRSLADFAKLVELFDAHGVSFVSVTQSFNTTTSMGRLTLNVLLSFAQFEREVTSERIRDTIAASKRRGLWVGGPVPLGYAAQNKKLVVVEEEAERVRLIFQLYLKYGSLGRLLPELRRRGVVTKRRELAGGRVIGGIPFTRGPLAYLLRNRFYLGEVVYRGKVNQGEHAAILAPELFAAVQERLTEQHHGFVRARAGSQALLLGRLFDDRGNRMSPTHAHKQGVRYRYYVTCALAQGRPEAAGSVARVAAAEVEQPVLQALREHRSDFVDASDRELIECCVECVVLHPTAIEIKLRSASCPVDGGEVHRAIQDDHSEGSEAAAGSTPIV